ncbi:D-alanine--D-alanine ligase [Candidatus Saccharibacteria bacterium]|nr:D-alanine--D-alanine ligase [Candidatus Saccharibacteria bacterium]
MHTPTKLRVGLLYGGQSPEHEVSVQSARNVYRALDTTLFEPILVAVTRTGVWQLADETSLFARDAIEEATGTPLALVPGGHGLLVGQGRTEPIAALDVVFPVLHGPHGEDGALQGLLELAGVPCVGPGILGSAVGMDKDVMKRLLREAGLPVTPSVVLRAHEQDAADPVAMLRQLGPTVYVKPANMGSSVGVGRADTPETLKAALSTAFAYDTKVLIETAASGREIECAVLGNTDPAASVLGCIAPRSGDFYSYEAKYLDENGAQFEVPARLPEAVTAAARQLAVKAYTALEAEGLARVDMFIDDAGTILINEINTLPGFTKISMYPKLWEASGLPYGELITKLIHLARERHQRRAGLAAAQLS